MRVVAYCRYSSDNQREESIDAQVRAINEFCLKEGHQLIKTYIDEAISATSTDNREEFNLMIDDSKKRLYDAVVVHKLDRFARNRYDSAIAKKRLKDNGAIVLSVMERLDDSPESVILESVLEGMAEYYSKNLSREVKKGLKENALKCLHTCGLPPLGFDVNPDKTYKINEREAIIVRKIFNLSVQGYGYSKISEILNDEGLKNKVGKEFRKTSIRDTLLNEKYIGTYSHGKKDANGKLTNNEIIIKNGMPRIITEEIFTLVQANFSSQNKSYSSPKSKVDYLLTGLVKCKICDGRYSGGYRSKNRNGSISYGYLCINRKNKVQECNCKPIRKELLENFVFETLKEKVFTPQAIEEISFKIFNYLKENTTNSSEIKFSLEKEEKKLKKNLESILDLLLDEKLDKETYEKKRVEIENKIQHIQVKKYNIKDSSLYLDFDKIKSYIIKMSQDFESGDTELLKNVFNTFIDKIEIDNDTIHVSINIFFMDMDDDGGSGGNRTRVQNC